MIPYSRQIIEAEEINAFIKTLKSNYLTQGKNLLNFENALNKKFNSSADMCDSILKDTGVALLPGSDFGFDQNKMLARLSFTDFDGQKFMNKIDDNKKIDNDTINEFAPKIIEGVNKLKKWSESI